MIFRRPATADSLTHFYGATIDALVADRMIAEVHSEQAPRRGPVLITSAEAKAGKTITAMALALTMARNKPSQQVLLVDLDLRNHGLTRSLNLGKVAGVAELAADEAQLDDVLFDTDLNNLQVAGAGQRAVDLPECFQGGPFRRFLEEVTQRYDMVFWDSPAMDRFADAKVLASLSDSVLLVANTKRTSSDKLTHARESLGEKLSGVLVNGYKDPVPSFLKRFV